jgi:serine/threonine protein phosphatase 1
MLKRLFGRARSTLPVEPLVRGRPPALPRGLRVFVVGDVHGRLDLLLAMEELIRADLRASGCGREAFVVHLGDFVDRGYDSRKVIDHLLASGGGGPTQVLLVGNHDVWLREFAAGGAIETEQAASWMRFGGDATLLSYGVKLDLRQPEPERLIAACEQLQRRLPAEHAEFLDRLEPACGLGDYFFCHAGIRPDVPLDQQTEADLLWIREPFLSWGGDCGKIIVHGHTVEEAPVIRSNRIGIDTGACWTGRLTCLVLDGTERRFLQTGR